MPVDDSLLFIDTNKYLDLYRTDSGKKLLALLVSQAENIFVTRQVVAEVQRNKLTVVVGFLQGKLKGMKADFFGVPDHLSGIGDNQAEEIQSEVRNAKRSIDRAQSRLKDFSQEVIRQVSRSEDDVSRALCRLFDKAVMHTQEELMRARERRALGHPPGKQNGAIGDQLSWEQILSKFNGKRRLWIISRDGDYGTTCNGEGFLNCLLYDELKQASPEIDVHLFENTIVGVKHFINVTGVSSSGMPSPEEAKEIELEERNLPRLDASPLDLRLPRFRLNQGGTLAGLLGAISDRQEIAEQLESISMSCKEREALLERGRIVEDQLRGMGFHDIAGDTTGDE